MSSRLSSILIFIFAFAFIFGCEEKPTEPEDTTNHLPEILQVIADPDQVFTLETTTLTCIAEDADGDDLDYAWACQSGSFPEGDSSSSVTWEAPVDTGLYIISVSVNDGRAVNPDTAVVISDSITVTVGYTHLSGNLTGTLSKNIYIAEDDITVPQDSTLTLMPGAALLFAEGTGLTVLGHLSAVGTQEDSIIFESDAGVTAWSGIIVSDTSPDSTIFQYCRITGASASGLTCHSHNLSLLNSTITGNSGTLGGGISLFTTDGTISDCNISDNFSGSNGGGIYCLESQPTILNCTINNNNAVHFGGGIACQSQSSPSIMNCIISDNTAEVQGGGIYCYRNSDFSIENCTIYGNSAQFGGGIFSMNSDPNVFYCLIYGNSSDENGGGIFCNESELTVEHCTISANSGGLLGGGIFSINSTPIVHNTIIESCTEGGGIFLGNCTSVSITYCDFFANQDSSFTGTPSLGLGELSTVNANGDSSDVFYNIFMDPGFIDPSSADFHLQWWSPCIDAGDPASPTDPNATVTDIGAFYYNQ